MSAYGYEIVQTLIVDIEPDEHVKRAMNEINAGNILISSLSELFEINADDLGNEKQKIVASNSINPHLSALITNHA